MLDVWFARWNDLVSFEVYPVITFAEAARAGTQPPGRSFTAPARDASLDG